MGLKRRLVVLLDILFPSRNMHIPLSSSHCLVRRNGSIAPLDLLGWVCFGYCLCCHSGCWQGSIEILDLVAVLALQRCGLYGIDIDWFVVRVLVALWWPRRQARLRFQSLGLRTEDSV